MSESDRPQRICRLSRPLTAALVYLQVLMCLTPTAQLIVGSMYQEDCENSIPVYLLVMGAASLLLALLSILPYTSGCHRRTWSCFTSFFFFCWFVAGNMWIYSFHEPDHNNTLSSMNTYCNKTLYLFAFWSSNLNYTLLGFFIFCSCCTPPLCSED